MSLDLSPLIVNKAEIDEALSILEKALKEALNEG